MEKLASLKNVENFHPFQNAPTLCAKSIQDLLYSYLVLMSDNVKNKNRWCELEICLFNTEVNMNISRNLWIWTLSSTNLPYHELEKF